MRALLIPAKLSKLNGNAGSLRPEDCRGRQAARGVHEFLVTVGKVN
jgi:hypothetical protein